MRKWLAVLPVLALFLTAAPAPADPGARVERQAFATWMIPTGRAHHFDWFYAIAWTHDGAGQFPNFAGIGKGHCVVRRTKRSMSVACIGNHHVSGDPATDFAMAPDGSSAELKVRKRGESHVVRWAAREPLPGSYFAEEYCMSSSGEEGQGVGMGTWRDAVTEGKIFGNRFKFRSRHSRWNELSMGAMVTQCSYFDSMRLTERGLQVSATIPRSR